MTVLLLVLIILPVLALCSAGLYVYYRGAKLAKSAEDRRTEIANIQNAVFNSSPYVVALWNEDGTVLAVSDHARELFDIYDPMEVGRRLYDFSPPNQPCGTPSKELAERWFNYAKQTGYAKFKWVHKTEEGDQRPVECVYKFFLHKDAHMMVSYTLDMREIEEVQKTVQSAFEFANTIIDAAPMVISIWDRYNNAVRISEGAKEMFGIDDPMEFSRRFMDFSPEYQPCGMKSSLKAEQEFDATRRRGVHSFTWVHQKTDGTPIYSDLIAKTVMLNGIEMIIMCNRDISDIVSAKEKEREIDMEREQEKQRAEMAEEINRAKTRFIARMSHEIRTPISAVMGISEIQIKNHKLSPAVEESFYTIHKSASALKEIVDDLLDFTKIEAGQMTLSKEKYEVSSLVNDAINMCYSYLDNKEINFIVKADENLPKYMLGDFVRIGQVISNLLSNAFKYTEHGKVTLSLSALPAAQEGMVTFVISVQDTGMGMTEEQKNRIFDEYSRFHENKKTIQGTGLGMTIVGSLIHLMDATIEIESYVSEGTTVTVKIPQEPDGTEVIGKEAARRLQEFKTSTDAITKQFDFEPESMPYGKVLVVDDVDANLYVSRGLLEFYDLQVDTVASGFIAIERVKQGNVYDIIFMDHMMPYMDGTETMQEIKRLGYTEPIVVLTANAIIGMADKFISEGFSDYLSKPIHARSLNAVLNRFIRDKQPPEVLANAVKKSAKNMRPNAELQEKLTTDFAAEAEEAVADLRQAIAAGDVKKAHLLSHSIKSRAALIEEQGLADMLQAMESGLMEGNLPAEAAISELGDELRSVLARITPAPSAESEKILALLDEIKPMLEERRNSSKNALGELRDIPEAAIFVRQVERYDFASALKSIRILRTIIEEGL